MPVEQFVPLSSSDYQLVRITVKAPASKSGSLRQTLVEAVGAMREFVKDDDGKVGDTHFFCFLLFFLSFDSLHEETLSAMLCFPSHFQIFPPSMRVGLSVPVCSSIPSHLYLFGRMYDFFLLMRFCVVQLAKGWGCVVPSWSCPLTGESLTVLTASDEQLERKRRMDSLDAQFLRLYGFHHCFADDPGSCLAESLLRSLERQCDQAFPLLFRPALFGRLQVAEAQQASDQHLSVQTRFRLVLEALDEARNESAIDTSLGYYFLVIDGVDFAIDNKAREERTTTLQEDGRTTLVQLLVEALNGHWLPEWFRVVGHVSERGGQYLEETALRSALGLKDQVNVGIGPSDAQVVLVQHALRLRQALPAPFCFFIPLDPLYNFTSC